MGAEAVETASIEREIVERVAAAKLRLRFDKVVLRLVSRLKVALAGVVREDESIIFTVSAPIRLPAKTAAAVENVVRGGLSGGAFRSTVHGNLIQVRRVTGVSSSMPRVMGFVHNPESDAGLILDMAGARLLERH